MSGTVSVNARNVEWEILKPIKEAVAFAQPVLRIFGAIGAGNVICETITPKLPMFGTTAYLTGTLLWGIGKAALTALYILPARSVYECVKTLRSGAPTSGQIVLKAKQALQTLVSDTQRQTKALLAVTAVYFAATVYEMKDLTLPWVGDLTPVIPLSLQNIGEAGLVMCGVAWLSSYLLSRRFATGYAAPSFNSIVLKDWPKTWPAFAIANGHLNASNERKSNIQHVSAAYALAYMATSDLASFLSIEVPAVSLFGSGVKSEEYQSLERAQIDMRARLQRSTLDLTSCTEEESEYLSSLEEQLTQSVDQYNARISTRQDPMGQFLSLLGT